MAMYYKRTTGGVIFDALLYVFLGLFSVTIILPFLFIISTSLSKPINLNKGGIFFLPRGFAAIFGCSPTKPTTIDGKRSCSALSPYRPDPRAGICA